jgi:hypothetical protein
MYRNHTQPGGESQSHHTADFVDSVAFPHFEVLVTPAQRSLILGERSYEVRQRTGGRCRWKDGRPLVGILIAPWGQGGGR